MKQNSTENMILRHLKDIKAKIEQKSIHTIKLPFEGPFKDKYAGKSPERILCLYSVRLVLLLLVIESDCQNNRLKYPEIDRPTDWRTNWSLNKQSMPTILKKNILHYGRK